MKKRESWVRDRHHDSEGRLVGYPIVSQAAEHKEEKKHDR